MESGLGVQLTSTKRTAPAFTLSSRYNGIDSPQVRESPGPGAYNTGGSIGQRAIDTTKKDAPKFSFGTDRTRAKAGTQRAAEPSPQSYQTNAGIGKQVVSQRASLPSYSFGSRTQLPSSHMQNPGPSEYMSSENRTTNRKNSAAFSFGTSSRDGGISQKIKRKPVGSDEPGPQSYNVDRNKVKTKAPSFTMSGWSKSTSSHSADGSGPAQSQMNSGLGKQVNAYHKTAPAYSFGGRFATPGDRERQNWPGPGSHGQYPLQVRPTTTAASTRRSSSRQTSRQAAKSTSKSKAEKPQNDAITDKETSLDLNVSNAVDRRKAQG